MNLPNALAILRMILAPILFFILINDFDIDQSWVNYFAALVFGIGALSDFFDGYIARAWGQKTKLGAIIDPLADKMLILAAFLGIILRENVDDGAYFFKIWLVYIILVREFFITGFRVVMVAQNMDISASFAGKLKTTFQMIAIIFLIMRWHLGIYLDDILLFVAFGFTLYSGFEYILTYIKTNKA